LDVTVGAEIGGAFGAGTIVALAPGATDATDITVGIGNGIAGVQTGTVTLNFESDPWQRQPSATAVSRNHRIGDGVS
jgi:hypothetical protein